MWFLWILLLIAAVIADLAGLGFGASIGIVLGGLFIIGFIYVGISNAKTSNTLKQIRKDLEALNIHSKKDFGNFENYVLNKAISPLSQLKLSVKDLCTIPSTLGIFGFSQSCLITSISIESTALYRNDPLEYFCGLPELREKHNFFNLVNHMYEGESLSSTADADLAFFQKHVKLLKEWNQAKFKLSCYRVIPEQDIAYYRIMGNKQYLSDVHGGGSNINGAIVGGVIAGGAGAIVGSRVGTEIKTNIKEHDTRRFFLYYREGPRITSEEIITNQIDPLLDYLRIWLPDKDYEYVAVFGGQNAALNTTQHLDLPESNAFLTGIGIPPVSQDSIFSTVPVENNTENTSSELQEYKELLDLGVITPAEYEEKKRQIRN